MISENVTTTEKMRIILGVDSRSRPTENFQKVKWLPFYDDVKINKYVLLYKV